MSKKLFVTLQGGLGNQLFQLAAGLSTARNNNAEVILLTGRYSGKKKREYELKSFEKSLEISSRKFASPLSLRSRISELKEFEFQDLNFNAGRRIQLDGYFQNPEFVRKCGTELVDAYLSAGLKIKKNLGCECSRQHVGIHIRRGDYLMAINKKTFGVLNYQYFRKISMEFANAHISIFTDGDIDEEVSNLADHADTYGRDLSAWATLSKMASMDILVISNSSLSWWAAYFGKGINPSQKIISPNTWFRGIPSSRNLILEEWQTRESAWIS